MRTLSILVFALLMTPSTLAAQTVYKCTDANGTVVYSQQPCSTDPAKVETIDTSSALKTGSGGSVAEQGDVARMSVVRRSCEARVQSVGNRYADVYRQISEEIAGLQARDSAKDFRVNDTEYHATLRSQIAALNNERAKHQAAEAKERESAQEKCSTEVQAEEDRQAADREARAKAEQAADKAAADKSEAGDAAKSKQDATRQGQ